MGIITIDDESNTWGTGYSTNSFSKILNELREKTAGEPERPIWFLDMVNQKEHWVRKSFFHRKRLAIPVSRLVDEADYEPTFPSLMTAGYAWLDFHLEGYIQDHWLVHVSHPPSPCGCRPEVVDLRVSAHPESAFGYMDWKYVVDDAS